MSKSRTVLISGASIAGLSAAYWMDRIGYRVTVVEQSANVRTGGAAVNVGGPAASALRRMGIWEELLSHRLQLRSWTLQNEHGATERVIDMEGAGDPDDIEIEREKYMDVLMSTLHGKVTFLFRNRIVDLQETENGVEVHLQDGQRQAFDLVLGCDGLPSGVRKIWFGEEPGRLHFMQHYFYLSIAEKMLLPEGTATLLSVPGKSILLNSYNGKTDIAFCFRSEQEISYDRRDADLQQQIVREQFSGISVRFDELLAEADQAGNAYFDQFCQVQLPFWSKGRVALIGDAAYCASPAAGCGAALAVYGAAALADALAAHPDNYEQAFEAYRQAALPIVAEAQEHAVEMLQTQLVPATAEALLDRNEGRGMF